MVLIEDVFENIAVTDKFFRTSPSACGIHLPFSREDNGTDDFLGFETNNYALRITNFAFMLSLSNLTLNPSVSFTAVSGYR